jgi:short-subunit dehydrogenase
MKTRKLALITGGAKGIGLSISERLASEGWDLVLWGRDEKALSSIARDLEQKHGGRVHIQTVDLATRGSVEPAFKALLSRAGFPNALICNAGDYGTLGRIGELDIHAWVRSFELNFFSAAELVHCFIREAKKKPTSERLKIILMSGSGLGSSKVSPAMTAYGCAKAAIYRFVEIVHEEVHSQGIDINCIAPGAVKTGIMDQALKHSAEAVGPLYHDAVKVQASGGDSPELAAQAISSLLDSRCDGLSGRLISAKWDKKFIESADGARKVSEDRDLLRLRRIDDELFERVPKR